MSFRAPPYRGSTPADLRQWADVLGREVEAFLNRLAIDVQLGRMRTYEVDALPDASGIRRMIVVSDETGGEVAAFNDGDGNWRRVTDRAIVS